MPPRPALPSLSSVVDRRLTLPSMVRVKIGGVSVTIWFLDKASAGRIAADAIEFGAESATVTHQSEAYAVDVRFPVCLGAGVLVRMLQFIAEKVHRTSLDEVMRAPGKY